MGRSRRLACPFAAAILLGALALAPPASAKRVEYAHAMSYIPLRVDSLIGFIPSHGMHQPVRPYKVRFGKRTYRFVYQNSSAVWPDTGMILRTLAKSGPGVRGAFVDRELTKRQRKRLVVRADLGRDADVLAVAAGHPACEAGLSRKQARRIARGKIRRWSDVAPTAAGQPDAIAVRFTTLSGAVEPRWGLTDRKQLPPGARGAADGGLSQAANGDLAVAALTSWSRARRFGASVCAAPIGGTAPTDLTVHSLRYRPAYRITYVVPRAARRSSRLSRAALKGFVDWLKGPQAAEQFSARGMMLKSEPPREPS